MKTRTKNILRQSIRLILSGSMLMTGAADAVLFDHGPSDPIITFPQWYRDEEGLALGLCRSTSVFCFPLATNPAGYPGNIGDEAFYNLVEFVGTTATTGNDFEYRYMGALEASYLPGPTPKHGDETVFARIRITFNFNDVNKEGTYTITHPFGVHTFTNVKATTKTNLIGAQAANFFTVDVPLGTGFEGALSGPVGPFIKWTGNLPLISGTEQFVGNPTIPHTFTGSPFGTNYLRIDGPTGSNIGGTGKDFIEVTLASVLGQIWTNKIATPLKIDSAALSRSQGKNGIDVWTTSAANKRIIVTGKGMPSLQLKQTSVLNNLPAFPMAKYHGHIEYPVTYTGINSTPEATPAQIKITNLTTGDALENATIGLPDVVKIKQATFDTFKRQISVIAESSDQISKPSLIVEGIPGLPSGIMMPCIVGSTEQCFTYQLALNTEPPEKITVFSAGSGSNNHQLVNLIGSAQNLDNPPIADNLVAPGVDVFTGGTSQIVDALKNPVLPAGAVIVQQPISGNVKLVNGVWVFIPNTGITVGADSFTYVIKNFANVSNLARVNLNIKFQPSAATGNKDSFAARIVNGTTSFPKVLNVLANDAPGSTNLQDQLDATTVKIISAPTKGSASVNNDGTITYTAKNTTGLDTFTYTVQTNAGITSAPTTVNITNFSVAETLTISRVDYTVASKKWNIVGSTPWFGGDLPNTTINCFYGGINTPRTTSNLIGTTAVVPTTGAFTLVVTGSPIVGTTGNSNLICQSSNGGLGAGNVKAK
ncbi:MAG: Ig-like domain-containing protein [Methylococcales bacterium]|nr:Ig-like domain-containing protein [Methylococcales bacterium]